jgi:hypothetical protein
MQGAERRVAERVRVTLGVTYSLNGGPQRSGTVENISHNGVLLVASEMLTAGATLRLRFSDPRSTLHHEVVGAVVRSATVRSFGVSFVHVDDTLLDYIRHLSEFEDETGAEATAAG